MKWVKDELIDEPSGLYPLFGSVYSGGGFTLGAGYRRYYGDNSHWDAKVLQSIRNYRLLEVSTDSWNHGGGRLDVHARAGLARRAGRPVLRPGDRFAAHRGRLRRDAGLRRRRDRLASAGPHCACRAARCTRTTRPGRLPAAHGRRSSRCSRRADRARARARSGLLARHREPRLSTGGRRRATPVAAASTRSATTATPAASTTSSASKARSSSTCRWCARTGCSRCAVTPTRS